MNVQPFYYKLFLWTLLALVGAWLLRRAPLWPMQASLIVFVDPAGSQDYSVKQSLSSATFEEWLLKCSLKSEMATRNKLAESLALLRRGKLLSVNHLRGPLWEVVWTESDSRVLSLLLEASKTYLDAGPARGDTTRKKPADDVERYELKLSRSLLAEASGAPVTGLDYVNPLDYAAAVRDQRKMTWKRAQTALREDLHFPLVRTLEVRPAPRPMPTWLYASLVLAWSGLVAGLLRPWGRRET